VLGQRAGSCHDERVKYVGHVESEQVDHSYERKRLLV